MKAMYLQAMALACLAAYVSAQGNYVDEYEYDNSPPPPRPNRPSANSFRPAPQAASSPRVAPVAILKQIDRHNDDGSYTYGYEGGDGSFKIETKLVSGEVMGKYGYVDDTGKVRVVEYGANRYGFMPSGEGITVAPPTLVDETTKKGDRNNQQQAYYDDGSYYQEEPAPPPRPAPRPAPRSRPAPRPQPQFDDYAPPPPPPPPAPRRQSSSSGPAPPRPVIPGAAPVFSPAPVYEERPAPSRSAPPPPPPQHVSRPQPRYEPVPQRSAPPQRFSAPQPQRFAPPPPPPPPPQTHPQRAQHARSSGGILDQLERDYALPQGGGQPTHDIAFSSY